ncbi:hypothetical protein FQN57_001326 [Myotisia sp. PD_48]|nr:hypothetical protein FQN57_001326 [Myotisia sp. PD_48]
MTDALSIEQNNKIRAALGLPPLPTPGTANDGLVFNEHNQSGSDDEEQPSTLETRAARGYDNWKAFEAEKEAQKRRQATKETIRRARENAQRVARLEGKGLGELDSNAAALDTKSWLMQHKKKQKKIEKERARKLAEELALREQEMAEYTSKDLAGVRVAHEIGEFDETEEQVLTLKDTTINEDDEEADELENIHLKEGQRTRENLELKKKKVAYDPNDMNASGVILSQYDEEINGKKRSHFTLGSSDITPQQRDDKRNETSSKVKPNLNLLDSMMQPEVVASDYLDASEIKIKKPKKKKAKNTRRRPADDEDIYPSGQDAAPLPSNETTNIDKMETDEGQHNNTPVAVVKKRLHDDTSFADDDDLQASLAAQRRAAFKKRKKLRPEDVAKQLREELEQAQNEMEIDGNEAEEGGLLIDETSEFVANLQRPTIPERQTRSTSHNVNEANQNLARQPLSPNLEETSDMEIEQLYNEIDYEEERKERMQRETSAPNITATGLEEEATLDQGLGATLAMLKQRSFITSSDGTQLNRLHRDRQRFLAEKHRRETDAEKRARTQRERDRASGKLDRMSARDREEYARWENKQRDQQESRQMADIFNREYKPDVQLKYIDEFGRQMNQKEAFKHLSHQFHGKGSGKMKTEKHLKKIEDEKKREAMSTLDSSQNTGMNNAMGATAKRTRQAGVRLA